MAIDKDKVVIARLVGLTKEIKQKMELTKV